jgi:hypothetical protein
VDEKGVFVNPCPFCGERFTTPYKYGSVYACQTLVLTSKPDGRTHQTWQCLRGEVAKLTVEINAMRTANVALTDELSRYRAVVQDPGALWANWLHGTVKLPSGIGDIRQAEDRAKRIEAAGDKLAERHLLVPTTYPQAQAHVAEYHKEKGEA